MHTEKQKIFDEYAESKGYLDWSDLKAECDENLMTEDEYHIFMFEAVDLVQKAQQERIAENAIEVDLNDGEYEVVTKQNILSEQNLIK